MIRAQAFASLVLAGACAAERLSPLEIARSTGNCTIYEAVDGDTVRYICPDGGRESARLMGFDTPETFQSSCAAERALGLRAKAVLQSKIEAARSLHMIPHGRDKYRRMLIELFVDGENIAQEMVREGLAVHYSGGKRINWCSRLERHALI